MPATKLYRKNMAELAGMTPVQYDYFVRIGAFAPDQGTTRKWYSPIEASMVLIAGQLMNYFKDQRQIVGVIEGLREHLTLHGKLCESIVEARLQVSIDEFVKQFELREKDPERYDSFTLPELADDPFVDHLILSMGYLADLKLQPIRSSGMARKEQRVEGFKLNVGFAEECCKRKGLNFEEELKASREQLERALTSSPSRESSTRAWKIYEYFMVVSGDEPTVYLQVAGNEDGSADVELHGEPTALQNRILWISLDLGKLFKRLSQFIPEDFIPLASKQLAAWEDA